MTIEEAKRRMAETAVFAHDHARRAYYEAFAVIEAALLAHAEAVKERDDYLATLQRINYSGVIKERDALKAEVERLTLERDVLKTGTQLRMEAAEADLAAARPLLTAAEDGRWDDVLSEAGLFHAAYRAAQESKGEKK